MSAGERASRLREVAGLALRLGLTAFGGPAVHIALLEREVVHRRGWLSEQEFLDLLGATNLIPGPNSTEMVIHIGQRRAGWVGLFAAGFCFILPAFLIVLLCAWLYVRWGALPQAAGVLYAVKPIVLALLVQVLCRLARKALATRSLLVIGTFGLVASLAGAPVLLVLIGCGAAAALLKSGPGPLAGGLLLPWVPTPAGALAGSAVGLWPLFGAFLKVGGLLYGSGYVLLAFLREDLVTRWGWLSEAVLLDALAIGQVTPGPVFTTATFIGYVLAGLPGAVVATVGIFLPAFAFVAMCGPLVSRIRSSALAGALLDGVNAAAVALLAAVIAQMAATALVDGVTIALAGVGAVLLLVTRINPTWLIVAAALIGWGVSG